jgi:uncharacterized protein (DUF1501 family)
MMQRRSVLKLLTSGAAAASLRPLVGCSTAGPSAQPKLNNASTSAANRVLVVIELSGGNDGLSTIVPAEDRVYQRLRPTLALRQEELTEWTDGYSLPKALAPLRDHGLAALHGVGSHQPNLSHHEMATRWWAGIAGTDTWHGPGFLGRLCDHLDAPGDTLVGVSLTPGESPAFGAEHAFTCGIGSANPLGLITEAGPDRTAVLAGALEQMARAGGAQHQSVVTSMLSMVDLLGGLAKPNERIPDSAFGQQLRLALQLISGDTGVRVIHIPMGGAGFDTHTNHRAAHTELMRQLGEPLAAFMAELSTHGLSERVLVATTSEFGRRVEEHNGGLDHGAASTALLLGPVNPGLHGEPSPLNKLDADGNLRATVEFDRYYATLAMFMGVDPADVLRPAARPISGLLTT